MSQVRSELNLLCNVVILTSLLILILLVPEMIEGIMRRMNRDQYKEARGEQEFMQKLRKRAHANNLKREEFEAKRGRLPVDYQY